MTDDIVTRLQASIDGDYFGSREDMKEAVAEIERLRKELAESEDYATDLWLQRQRGDWKDL